MRALSVDESIARLPLRRPCQRCFAGSVTRTMGAAKFPRPTSIKPLFRAEFMAHFLLRIPGPCWEFLRRRRRAMRHRVIHLVNPKTDSLTTRPLYLNRALYSPIAGLLAVAAAIPRDRYEVRLTDENIEEIDFDLSCDLVGI